jgi:hypothetical protein
MKSFLTILAIFLCCKKLSSQNLQDLWIGDNGYYLKIGTLNSHNLTIEYFNDKECKREDGRYQYFLLGDTLRVEDKISKFLAQKRKIDYKFRFDFSHQLNESDANINSNRHKFIVESKI